MKICCILNDKSGSAASVDHSKIVDLFSTRGVSVDILTTREGASIGELAAQAVQQNYEIIVAGGGDGTINAVATALVVSPDIRLGVLPLGTLNHFARDLGIPFDLSKAIDIICVGHSAGIDIGVVNDSYFLNNSSVGLYPAIVKLRESLQNAGYSKRWAALLSGLRILGKFRKLDLEVKPSGSAMIKRQTPLIFIGNNAYNMTAANLGTRAAINRGQLWISVPISSTRWGLIKGLIALVFQREKPGDILIFEATSLKVNSRKKLLAVATDGEVLRLKPPLNYRILPKALNVIVPLAQDKAK